METLKILQTRRTKRGNTAVIAHPLGTEGFKPTQYCTENFSDLFYTSFFNINNNLVDIISLYHINPEDIKDEYSNFYELGMRVSQQLDGKFRETTVDKYARALDALHEKLLPCLIESKTSKRNENLERLVSDDALQGMPDSDKEKVRSMVQQLKERPIQDYSKRETSIAKRVEKLAQDGPEKDKISEYYLAVPPDLRADYLEVIKYIQQHDGRAWFEGEYEPIKDFVCGMKVENARLYLKALKMELERNKRDINDFFRYTCENEDAKNLSEEQKRMFFEALVKAQEENIPHSEGYLHYTLAELFGKRTPEEARIIVDEAFAKFKETGADAGDYISSKLRE